MSEPRIVQNDAVITCESDMIDVTPMTIIDLAWRYTDPNGHEHAWRQTNVGTPSPPSGDLPTLEHVEDVPATDEYPAIGHYECRQCRARVEPGWTSNTQRYMIAGLPRVYINGEPATQEQIDALKAKYIDGAKGETKQPR